METKVLLRLIRDDLKLLDGTVASLISDGQPEQEEVEVALIRAQGIVTEFEMLSKNLAASPKDQERPAEAIEAKAAAPVVAKAEVIVKEDADLIDLVEEPPMAAEEVETPAKKEPAPQPVVVDTFATAPAPVKVKTETKDVKHEPVISEEMAITRKGKASPGTNLSEDHPRTLGEAIGDAHQLVHDLLVPEQEEHLFEGKPLMSIREGIGLNDRFLFIRELFAGDSVHYNETLDQLDSFPSIKEAVEFMKVNFKWSKSEAGEKFLHLVKRRYSN